jgi:hypothetical protein
MYRVSINLYAYRVVYESGKPSGGGRRAVRAPRFVPYASGRRIAARASHHAMTFEETL